MSTMIRNYHIDRVREAVSQYIRESDGEIELWHAQDGVAKILGLSANWRNLGNSTDVAKAERLANQVSRVLNAMVGPAGPLRKVGKNEPGPRRTYAGQPIFYTHEAWTKAVDYHEAKIARLVAEQERWERVHDELTARGAHPWGVNYDYRHPDGRGTTVQLRLEDWEKLLEMGQE